MSLDDDVSYSTPGPADFAGLRAMARQAFADTFSNLFEPEPFTAFLEQTYGLGGSMERDLTDPSVEWRIASEGPEVVGYAKLRPLVAPAPAPEPNSRELQQLYVLARWKGRGVAACLMEWAIGTAKHAGATELYLTVFDHNDRAKRFYTRYGFSEIGRCIFVLGDQANDDRVWRMLLTEQATAHEQHPARSVDPGQETRHTEAQVMPRATATGEAAVGLTARGRPRRLPDEDLVRAALDLVLELGPASLTFAKLAERVSMVPASIAHRFGNRDNLMAEISHEVTRRFEGISTHAMHAGDGVDSVVEFLVELCRPGATPASVINQVSLMQIELAAPALSADVARRSRGVRTVLRSMLEIAAERGELSCDNRDALAAALHDTQVGALLNWCVNPAGELRERVERDVRFVLRPFVTGAAGGMSVDGTRTGGPQRTEGREKRP